MSANFALFIGCVFAIVGALALYAIALRRRLHRAERRLREAVQQFEELAVQLKQRSGIDALTGLPNRASFDDTLRREWVRGMRTRQPLAMLMIDIDHFKQHNDTYGHLAGDECLRRVAETLASCVKRPADSVTRYGGEEFCVILPGTDAAGAVAVAERMRAAVGSLALSYVPHAAGRHVTISVGVAVTVPRSDQRATDLVAKADEALYTAKMVGRDQVILAGAQKFADARV